MRTFTYNCVAFIFFCLLRSLRLFFFRSAAVPLPSTTSGSLLISIAKSCTGSSGFEGGTSGSILKRYAASEADVVQRESFYLETRKDPPKKMQDDETHVRRRIISQLVSPLCLISTLPALLLLLLTILPPCSKSISL